MLAGFAKVDITPSVGSVLNGFVARTRPSTGVDVTLAARALWLEEDAHRVLIVGLDVLGLSPAYADHLVARLAAELKPREEMVLLACSHTHSGPMTAPLRGIGPADERYLEALEHSTLEAALLAASRKCEVRAAWGTAPVAIGVNRRQVVQSPEGPSVILGRNSDGRFDPAVRVLSLQGGGRSILLFQHACHPYCLGGDCTLASSDFWGHAAECLAQEGHDCIYLNGCAGDIAPVLGFGGPQAARDTGRRLAEAVLAAYGQTQPVRECSLRMESRRLDLPHDHAPDLAEVHSQLRRDDHTVRDVERADPVVVERIQTAWREWGAQLEELLTRSPVLPPVAARISVIRVGDGGIVALPGEIFYGTGQAIAGLLVAEPACIAAYTHGYIGYVPDGEAYALGGYEVEEAHRYVGLWRISPLATDLLQKHVFDLWKLCGGQLQ